MREYFTTFFPAGHGKSILVADDSVNNLRLMRIFLQGVGFQNILIAENGGEAFRIYAEKKDEIMLVVSDVQMPVMTGFQLFWRLMKEVGDDVRVLLCSGGIYSSDIEVMRQAGLSGYLPKPFTADQFLAAVAKALA